MATYADEKLGDTQVYPEKGTVSFSAGLHGWAFTLTVFSAIYAKRFGVEEAKMMEKLWGDNFFDPATKKWTKKSTGSATCKRGFVQFVYDPIKTIIEGVRAFLIESLFFLRFLSSRARSPLFLTHPTTTHPLFSQTKNTQPQPPSTTTRPSCLSCATSWASPPRSRRRTGSCPASRS
jgi:hypothetical protein